MKDYALLKSVVGAIFCDVGVANGTVLEIGHTALQRKVKKYSIAKE